LKIPKKHRGTHKTHSLAACLRPLIQLKGGTVQVESLIARLNPRSILHTTGSCQKDCTAAFTRKASTPS